MPKHIGILTSGGDCPGLNAAIRGVGKAARDVFRMEMVGFRDGFRGLVDNRSMPLESNMLSGILTSGGTILGTSRDKPHQMEIGGEIRDMTPAIVETYARNHLDAMVCIGGGGTQKNALRAEAGRAERRHSAQNHRQRHRPDRRLLRFRHGAGHRHRGDRPAAFDGHQPQSNHRGRDDGPSGRLAGPGRGHCRRRRRHPHSRNPLPSRAGRRSHPRPGSGRKTLQHRRRGRRGHVG